MTISHAIYIEGLRAVTSVLVMRIVSSSRGFGSGIGFFHSFLSCAGWICLAGRGI